MKLLNLALCWCPCTFKLCPVHIEELKINLRGRGGKSEFCWLFLAKRCCKYSNFVVLSRYMKNRKGSVRVGGVNGKYLIMHLGLGYFSFCSINNFVWEPHSVVLRAFSWFCPQESLLVVLMGLWGAGNRTHVDSVHLIHCSVCPLPYNIK